MKNLSLLFAVILLAMTTPAISQKKSFHDFSVTSIDGKTIDLSVYKGKKVLVVNTASKCGLTPQYSDLQALFEKYSNDDFVIIGFPANNFMNQEPGTDDEIREFCEVNYGVTFPMMSKISVKGDDKHPLYQWLTSEEENGVSSSEVTWNFQKYMIDENGKLVDYAEPKVSPLDEKIVSWIEG